MSSPPPERGAYGFRLRGVDGAQGLLVDAPAGWPSLHLHWRVSDAPLPEHELVCEERAELLLTAGGSVCIDRAAMRADYLLPDAPSAGAIVHPHLAPVASIAARWLGRESFHGGSVVLGGGAWALLGDKESGKSSTLAWLALTGNGVLSDDLLVLDGLTALAGPRSIDLRAQSAGALGVGEPLGRIGLRERWRLQLAPVAAEVPLHGWIVLAWHDGPPTLTPLRGAQRLEAIVPHRAVRLAPVDPLALVELSALPCYRLTRPRAWSSLDGAAELLVQMLGGQWPVGR